MFVRLFVLKVCGTWLGANKIFTHLLLRGLTFQYGRVNSAGSLFTPLHSMGSPSPAIRPPNLVYSARKNAHRTCASASIVGGGPSSSSVANTCSSLLNGWPSGSQRLWLPPYTTFDRCSENRDTVCGPQTGHAQYPLFVVPATIAYAGKSWRHQRRMALRENRASPRQRAASVHITPSVHNSVNSSISGAIKTSKLSPVAASGPGIKRLTIIKKFLVVSHGGTL